MPTTSRRRPKVSAIGAHVPVAKGLARGGLEYADRIGAEAVQVFVSNPRGWAPAPGRPTEDAAFRDRCGELDIPVFVHAPYLINFGSPTAATLEQSSAALTHSLVRAVAIGARGVVVHAGSAVAGNDMDRALRQVREAMLPVLDAIGDGGPRLLIEPTAGGGQALAARVEDLEAYFAALDSHPALGVCLDTCHAFAAGHDLRTKVGVRRMLSALTKAVGRKRLDLLHANDSRDPIGSLRDRHATIGAGEIGERGFVNVLTHPAVRGVPVILETPEAHHADDVALLKRLRDS